MSNGQVTVVQNVKQFFPYNVFSIEYSLVAVFLVLLALETWIRRSFKRFRFRDLEHSNQKYYYFDSLPGPSSLPIIGSLHHLRDLRSTINMLHDYSRRFGPVVKCDVFSETFVILNNAPMTQIMLQSSEMGHFAKSPIMYDMAFQKILGTGVITSTGEHWKTQRKLLSPAFSFKSFQNYTNSFIKYSTKLVQDLDRLFQHPEGGNEKPRQINSVIHLCGMQIISESVMGLDLCNDKDGLTFYDSVRRTKTLVGQRLHNPLLMLDFFWKLHPLSKEFAEATETINAISRKMIAKHKMARLEAENKVPNYSDNDVKEETFKGRNMIEEMLRANMSESDIMYEVNTMIFAGFETTSAAAHYLTFLLALNPDHQRLCREEIDAVFSDPMKCPNGKLTYDAINDLKYLERCLNESLRLFPPIFAFFRKLEEPLKLSDTLVIPKGVNIAIPPLSLHKNPEYFPNPEKFDPDRFLPENVRVRHPYAFIPFSGGSRTCIGTKFAMMAAKAMGAQIIRNFEVYTTDSINDVNLLPNIFLTPERDYNFILKRRENIPR